MPKSEVKVRQSWKLDYFFEIITCFYAFIHHYTSLQCSALRREMFGEFVVSRAGAVGL